MDYKQLNFGHFTVLTTIKATPAIDKVIARLEHDLRDEYVNKFLFTDLLEALKEIRESIQKGQ